MNRETFKEDQFENAKKKEFKSKGRLAMAYNDATYWLFVWELL